MMIVLVIVLGVPAAWFSIPLHSSVLEYTLACIIGIAVLIKSEMALCARRVGSAHSHPFRLQIPKPMKWLLLLFLCYAFWVIGSQDDVQRPLRKAISDLVHNNVEVVFLEKIDWSGAFLLAEALKDNTSLASSEF